MTAGVAGADGQRVFAGTQGKWIQAEIIGGLAVGLDDGAVHNPFDVDNLGLTADGDRHRFSIGQGRLVIQRKIGGQDRRQRGHFKISLKRAGIAINIADGNIEGVTVGRSPGGFNGIAFASRDGLSIDGVFNAGDVLVGLDVHCDLGCIGQRGGEQVGGQGQQGDWNRRAQDGGGGCALSVGGDIQRKAVTAAIGGNGSAEGDDVLRAEEIGEAAVDVEQFFWSWQIIENSVRFAGDRF